MPESSVAALFRSRASSVQLVVVDRAVAIAVDLGFALYLVGGVVRDLLTTGRLHDLDLTIVGDAIELARHLADDLGARLRVHQRFSTAEIALDGERVDLVTARSEEYPEPAALPHVSPGSLEDDLYRRDFSVNAMAICLWPEGDPGLIDPFDGRSDLADGRLRVLHDRSFVDDPTRLLRGARLGARLGLEFESHTAELAVAAIAGDAFAPLTGTRLRRELALLLEDQRPSDSLRVLDRFGFHTVLGKSEPFAVADLALLEALAARRHESEAPRDPGTGGAEPVQWWLASLIGLFRAESRATRTSLAQRLQLEGAMVEVFVESGERLTRLDEGLEQAGTPAGEIGAILDRLSAEERMVARVAAAPAVRQRLARQLDEWRALGLEIGGHDLIAAGYNPGPQIGRALEATLAARREGRIGVDDELEFAMAQLDSQRKTEDDE